MENKPGNRKRVELLKKAIVRGRILVFCLLTALCVVLFVSNRHLTARVDELTKRLSDLENADYTYEESGVYSVGEVAVFTSSEPSEGQSASASEIRRVYLTFDDGPSSNTDRILDILKEYDVKATFFVTGKEGAEMEAAYRRIVEEGHTLGMHSYSHRYSEVYESAEAFAEDLHRLQEYLYEVTGVWPRFYRFPGGSSNTVSKIPVSDLIGYLNEEGIVYFDWNIASGDAIEGTLSAERIKDNCLAGIEKYDDCVILMHDAADRNTTVEALPAIIEEINARGDCSFLPISNETTPVQHVTVRK